MITWDAEEVARFFGIEAERPHDEDTEFIFTFDSDGRDVQLIVQPYNDYATLALAGRDDTSPSIELRMDCVSIVLDDTEDDNSSAPLILNGCRSPDPCDENPVRSSYWVRIAPVEGTFVIQSNFTQQFADSPQERGRSNGHRRLSGCTVVLLVVAAVIAVIAILFSFLGAA